MVDYEAVSKLNLVKNINSKEHKKILKQIFKEIKPIEKTLKVYKDCKDPQKLLSNNYLVTNLKKPRKPKNNFVCIINISPGVKIVSLNKKKIIIDKDCYNFITYKNTVDNVNYNHFMIIPQDSTLVIKKEDDIKKAPTDETLITEILEVVDYINNITDMIVSSVPNRL
jgi:hypothetical protein